MATEEQKKENIIRMLELIVQGLAKGLYDLFGESSYAVMQPVGDELLSIMEKEMGFEVGGENEAELAKEFIRLFVDEFGLAEKIDTVNQGNVSTLVVHGHKGFNTFKRLKDLGVKDPFVEPIMNIGAALIKKRLGGMNVSKQIELAPDIKGVKITYKFGS